MAQPKKLDVQRSWHWNLKTNQLAFSDNQYRFWEPTSILEPNFKIFELFIPVIN
jgi:hypothetical protein